MWVSHKRYGKFENSLNYTIILDLHRSPVSRELLELGSTYLLQERYLPVPTNPCKCDGMGMHSLATVVCQIGGKYRKNIGNASRY